MAQALEAHVGHVPFVHVDHSRRINLGMAYSIIYDYELASGLFRVSFEGDKKTVVRPQDECSDRPVAAAQIVS